MLVAIAATAIMLLMIVAASYQLQVSRANSDIANLNSQISLLQSQNSALEIRTAALQSLSENSSTLMLKVDNLTAIIGLNRSAVLMNDTMASQHGGNLSNPGFMFWNNFSSLEYAGYVVITIHSSNATDCLLEASWSGLGTNMTQVWQFGSDANKTNGLATLVSYPASAVLPVLPTSNLQIGVVNLGTGESVENISAAYYF